MGYMLNLAVSGVRQEAEMSAYSAFFTGIVRRAIQIDRVGKMGIPQISPHYRQDYPEDIVTAISFLRGSDQVYSDSYFLSGKSVDCNLPISLKEVEITRFDPTVSILLSYDPMHYVVFFYGPIPDIAQFLENGSNPALLGPITHFSKIEENEIIGNDVGFELGTSFEIVRSALGEEITYSAHACDNYSYIEFRGPAK